jgi:ATP-binding cassette subfamily C (CFTR/MRP) protein 1
MVALFHLVELVSGSICIDGVDISKVGLNDFRNAVSIIPQDATLCT